MSSSSSTTPSPRRLASPESTAAVRVSSPLNPSTTPTKSPGPLPPPDPPAPPPFSFRPRGHSISTLRVSSPPSSPTNPLTRVTSTPSTSHSPISVASDHDDRPRSTFRSRSKSPAQTGDTVWTKTAESPTPPDGAPSTWWGGSELVPRPWRDPPRKKKTVPAEQTEGWVNTRQRVAQAAASILGTAGDVAHEALLLSADLLEFAPIPGLQTAARTLLNIWDALQQVDMNRLACLRLTERCAQILLSIRQEVKEAGDTVGDELAAPVAKLVESFHQVHQFLQKQIHRPFLKRYLKRDEILRQIAGCDAGLTESLGMFSISIQIRILKQVQAAEARRQADTQALLNSIMNARPPSSNALHLSGVVPPAGYPNTGGDAKTTHTLTGLPPSSDRPALPSNASSSTITQYPPPPYPPPYALAAPSPGMDLGAPRTPESPSQVLPTLRTLHDMQNYLDAAHDTADLRQLMRAALQTSSDAEMLGVLQVGREEMPEAIKTLQRALERVVEREGAEVGVGAGVGAGVGTSVGASAVEGRGPGVGEGVGEGARVKNVRRVSIKRFEDVADAVGEGAAGLKRSKTVVSTESAGSSSGSGGGNEARRKDTLDREFIESGIDALRRMSKGVETTLPSWTITRYEVDREQKIGIGFFSDVYKGTWRGRSVAIKVLAESTPRGVFVREMGIWKTLRHPNVLELYGASSASGDPPWFFVSPYERNGSLVEFLKRVAVIGEVSGGGIVGGGGGGGFGLGLGLELGAAGRLETVGATRGRTGTFPVWRGGASGSRSPGRELFVGRKRSPDGIAREGDLFRFMHEIAKGMEYLHQNGVLHGDLKAANVLVDDKIRCVISDFGQSEMKSEAYRISGAAPPHGTLRWQAPELMAGLGELTPEMDVYAYAICCIEILTMGRMPWPLMDDDTVRHFVLKDNTRPVIPNTRFSTPALQELLRICWHRDPSVRPSFSKIVRDVKQMRTNTGLPEEVYSPTIPEVPEHYEEYVSRPSPDMHPVPLPLGTPPRDVAAGVLSGVSPGSEDSASFRTARDMSQSPPKLSHMSHREDTVASSRIHMPEPVLYTPSVPSSRASSIFTHTPSSQSEENLNVVDYEGYDSPPPVDEWLAEIKNERRYRLLLSHQFHPSLTLPLWDPVPVTLGAVGYLSKPSGSFVTLFNSFHPEKCSAVKDMPSLFGYGRVLSGSQRQDKRNAAQRGLDAFVGLLTFKSKSDGPISQSVSRRYSFPLRAGHKTAYLCTETTMYHYVENLEAPKKWFKANVDTIMQTFGAQHHIQKEDLFLVIGTLDTPDYALFVSHNHSDGQAHFNVFSAQRTGQPWGTFTTDTEVPPELGGPTYDEPVPGNPLSASKVSSSGGRWDTVLIAKLRFKPDVLEPTSL